MALDREVEWRAAFNGRKEAGFQGCKVARDQATQASNTIWFMRLISAVTS
jgi:hypothetical protein